jgi:hypothetical protein
MSTGLYICEGSYGAKMQLESEHQHTYYTQNNAVVRKSSPVVVNIGGPTHRLRSGGRPTSRPGRPPTTSGIRAQEVEKSKVEDDDSVDRTGDTKWASSSLWAIGLLRLDGPR